MRTTRKRAECCLAAIGILLAPVSAARADFFERLFSGRLHAAQDGVYLAGDKRRFELQRDGNDYLLRFDGDPETFVLTSDRTSLGGRMLKYDTGEIALRVAGWGALTLYTDEDPNGLPAERLGDTQPLVPPAVSLEDLQRMASLETEHFRHLRHLRIVFVMDWNVLETNAGLRVTASNALENAALALERFTQPGGDRRLVARRIGKVTLATGRFSGVRLEQHTLIVTFNPEIGYAGCDSSRVIQRSFPALLKTRAK